MAAEKKPLGDSIRDIINPALEDPRCAPIQLEILNDAFGRVIHPVQGAIEQNARAIQSIFNSASSSLGGIEKVNPFIIRVMTETDPFTGGVGYSPVMAAQLPLSTAFTKFSAEDVKALPNYIKLHEIARAENVALSLVGVVSDDMGGGGQQPLLVVNCAKTYEEGQMAHGEIYPDLPSPEEKTPKERKPKTGFKDI